MFKDKYYEIKAKSDTEVDIFIYSVIGRSWFEESVEAKNFVTDFKKLEEKYQRINIRINSPGGSIWDGLPIFNVIYSSKIDTHTYNDGIAYSMANIVMEAGKTRHSAKNGMFLLHSPLGGAIGNAKLMREMAEELDKYAESLMTSIVGKNELTEEEIKEKWFDYEDHLMTAKEALEEGLIDVIDDYEAKVDKKKAIKDIKAFFTEDKKIKPLATIKNLIIEAINQFTPNDENDEKIKNLTDMKNSKRFIDALNIDEETPEDQVEDMIFEAIQNILQAKADAEADKEISENALQDAVKVIDAIDETVAEADGVENKTIAIISLINELKENPAGNPKDLSPDSEIPKGDDDPCTVKDLDTMEEAMEKIGEEYNITESKK